MLTLHLASDLPDNQSVRVGIVLQLLHIINVFQSMFGSIPLRPFQRGITMHNIGTFSLVKVVFDGVAGNNDGHLFGMVKILKSNKKFSKYRVLQIFYVVDNKLFVSQ